MLFSEIYGSYFNVIATVLSEAADGTLTANRLTTVVQEKAFAESTLHPDSSDISKSGHCWMTPFNLCSGTSRPCR